ncbi:MAG: hypothetical protein L0Y64_02540 [Myxococcaceae bacterium]|nr:hypothetical protein [Myxococcaceae bacterium]
MNPGVEVIGWFSSLVLVLTLARQVLRQWQEGSGRGESTWLFVGQLTASTGFTFYSVLVGNWVFVVTNALMFLTAFMGIGIVMAHRRRDACRERDCPPRSARIHEAARARTQAV